MTERRVKWTMTDNDRWVRAETDRDEHGDRIVAYLPELLDTPAQALTNRKDIDDDARKA